MKWKMLFAVLVFSYAAFAGAQIVAPSTDVLGAHLNYGRGCAACHAPHSSAHGNGKTVDAGSGNSILWGEDVSSLRGRTIATGGGRFIEVLPSSMSATTPDVNGILTCLSCHDGNLAPSAMMRNRVYENLPLSYGNSSNIPTLIENTAGGASNVSEHPLGLSAAVHCGGVRNWDCAESKGVIKMNGPASSKFVQSYGQFVQLSAYNNRAVVTCTSCHDQHRMNVVSVSSQNSGQPAGNYATTFFLRGPYNPASGTANSNQTSQFCRQCHGDLSNEMNGSTAGTVY
jgi:hypothetical protein